MRVGRYGAMALAGVLLGSSMVQATEEPVDDFLIIYYGGEDMVETATRVAKPISQVAENVTVITAAEIERMNANGVDEVLNRVAGLFVDQNGLDFNNNSSLYIHGSSFEHVTVLLDGVAVNKTSIELAWVNIVPVQIVKRIEVIKGAASSTWGSAFGGVINIITKDGAKDSGNQVDFKSSLGEYGTSDLTAELTGRTGLMDYYLYGGDQRSDGILDDRFYENSNGYGKVAFALPGNGRLEFSGLYTRPQYATYRREESDRLGVVDDNNFFGAVKFDKSLSGQLNLHVDANYFENPYHFRRYQSSDPDTLQAHFSNEQASRSVAARLDYQGDAHSVVTGFDYHYNALDMVEYVPSSYVSFPIREELFGVYVNDTMRWGQTTITPGLRYDHMSTTPHDQLSPSLGLTYQLQSDWLLRVNVARGFRKPPVQFLHGDPGYSPSVINPDLRPEESWSYQLGMETGVIPVCHVKTTLFYHDVKNTWVPGVWWTPWRMNGGKSHRQGAELEIQTLSWYHLSLHVNMTYVHSSPISEVDWNDGHVYEGTDDTGNANLILLYDNPQICTAELSGHWVAWGHQHSNDATEDETIVWDISVNKELLASDKMGVTLFGVARNLFNEQQYTSDSDKSAGRWLEAGLKFRF